MIIENILGKRVKELRIANNITQLKLGEQIGLSKQAINDIEQGRRQTLITKLILIADYFNIPLDYLTGRGLFSNWELIIENKDVVFETIEQGLGLASKLNLYGKSNQELMFILPAFIKSVDFQENDIKITLY